MLVKICGLRERECVNAAVAAGADAVGFVFAESVRRVTVDEAVAAATDVPARVLRVAVMLHPDVETWKAVADGFRPDVLQTDIGDFDYLSVPDGVSRWPVIREGADDIRELPATFVYEAQQSGKGQRVDLHRAATVARRGNMILAGGLNANSVAEAVTTVAPYGVDVSSAVESAPGRKDKNMIASFITAAKAVG